MTLKADLASNTSLTDLKKFKLTLNVLPTRLASLTGSLEFNECERPTTCDHNKIKDQDFGAVAFNKFSCVMFVANDLLIGDGVQQVEVWLAERLRLLLDDLRL